MNMKQILMEVQDTLNNSEIQNRFGFIFEKMNPEEKANFMACLLYQLAEKSPEVVEAMGNNIYDTLSSQ